MMTVPRFFLITAALTLTTAWPATAGAQTPLTLDEALRLAVEHSESVAAARANETRAEADTRSVGSQKLPQVNLSASYSRTLASEFSNAFSNIGGGDDSSIDFGRLPFGQKNIYNLGFTFSQVVYAGGRISAQQKQADTAQRSTKLATSTTEAEVELDVTRAFFDAALGDRLVAIAQSTYDQAAATYEQTRLAFDAGRQPEFELLRAQVAREAQRPVVIRRTADRDVAYLRLRQLLELPAGTPLVLDADLESATLPPPAPFAAALTTARPASIDEHLAVQQTATTVALRESAVSVAHAERLPSVGLGSTFGRVGYPSSGAFPVAGDFRTNWSVAATLAVPLYTGGRLLAQEAGAKADLTQARAQLKQVRELAELDAATALQDLAAAQAVWEASASTVEQAERAYQIADLRNREGLSTQLELSDSRLSLQVAQATRALAARDVQVARARLALIPSLPLGTR